MAGGKEIAWRLRIDFTDGTSELDDEIYETEDEAIDSRNDWYEGWKSGAETLELAGEDFDSRKIEDIEIFEE